MKPKYMTRLSLFAMIIALASCTANGQKKNVDKTEAPVVKKLVVADTVRKVVKTEEEWKTILTPDQYSVLREKGTDRPFTGEYTYHKEDGTYHCAACGLALFTSDMKFDSNCGWPSFDKEIAGGKIVQQVDKSHGMVRVEILCGRCGSHLGHIFDDGPTLTGKRYCVNSTSIDFTAKEKKK
jgi:peptide-methionine (R)-S-oxide reductase